MNIRHISNKIISKINRILAIVDKESHIDPKAQIYRFARIINTRIGKYSYVGIRSKVIDTEIGNFCSIASEVQIGLEEHSIHNLSTSPIFTENINATGHTWIDRSIVNPRKKTLIGNDVWIGYRALIKGGVSIGNGAIVGAGAIVTKDVPSYAIVAGVPAKIIRFRFSEEIINEMNNLEWWNLDDDVLKRNIQVFHKDELTIESLEILKDSNNSK